MNEYKHFRAETVDDVVVLHLTDSDFFDRLIINQLQDEMIQFVKTQEPSKLLINFGRVKSLSSETIGALIRAREYTVANGGTLKLCDMRDEIRAAFKMLNLEGKMFEIHDSMPSALDAF